MNPLAHSAADTLYLCRVRPGAQRVAVVHVRRDLTPRIRTLATYNSRYAATIDLEQAGFRSNGIEDPTYGEIWMRPWGQGARRIIGGRLGEVRRA